MAFQVFPRQTWGCGHIRGPAILPTHPAIRHEGGSYRGERAETMSRIARPPADPTSSGTLKHGCNPWFGAHPRTVRAPSRPAERARSRIRAILAMSWLPNVMGNIR